MRLSIAVAMTGCVIFVSGCRGRYLSDLEVISEQQDVRIGQLDEQLANAQDDYYQLKLERDQEVQALKAQIKGIDYGGGSSTVSSQEQKQLWADEVNQMQHQLAAQQEQWEKRERELINELEANRHGAQRQQDEILGFDEQTPKTDDKEQASAAEVARLQAQLAQVNLQWKNAEDERSQALEQYNLLLKKEQTESQDLSAAQRDYVDLMAQRYAELQQAHDRKDQDLVALSKHSADLEARIRTLQEQDPGAAQPRVEYGPDPFWGAKPPIAPNPAPFEPPSPPVALVTSEPTAARPVAHATPPEPDALLSPLPLLTPNLNDYAPPGGPEPIPPASLESKTNWLLTIAHGAGSVCNAIWDKGIKPSGRLTKNGIESTGTAIGKFGGWLNSSASSVLGMIRNARHTDSPRRYVPLNASPPEPRPTPMAENYNHLPLPASEPPPAHIE